MIPKKFATRTYFPTHLKITLNSKLSVYVKKYNVASNQTQMLQMIGTLENQGSRLLMIVLSGVIILPRTAEPMELVVVIVEIFLIDYKHLFIRKMLHLITKRAVVKQDVSDGVIGV